MTIFGTCLAHVQAVSVKCIWVSDRRLFSTGENLRILLVSLLILICQSPRARAVTSELRTQLEGKKKLEVAAIIYAESTLHNPDSVDRSAEVASTWLRATHSQTKFVQHFPCLRFKASIRLKKLT